MNSYPHQILSESGPLIRSSDTGLSRPEERNIHFVDVRCDNYLVTVALDPQGRFLGVARITAAGDFLTPMQQLAASGHHDVEQFYRDAEP